MIRLPSGRTPIIIAVYFDISIVSESKPERDCKNFIVVIGKHCCSPLQVFFRCNLVGRRMRLDGEKHICLQLINSDNRSKFDFCIIPCLVSNTSNHCFWPLLSLRPTVGQACRMAPHKVLRSHAQ